MGLTAKVLSAPLFARDLVQLAFPVYLLHRQVAWFWYFATRGSTTRLLALPQRMHPQFCDDDAIDPVPIPWYEVPIVIVLTLAVSWLVNAYVVPVITPPIVRAYGCICCCGSCLRRRSGDLIAGNDSALLQVQVVIRRLTGARATQETRLDSIGLDSF